METSLIAILLGIIEGITEFLPISSTGHLILANALFSFEGPFARVFDIVIQTGAITAVLILFWKDLHVFHKNKIERTKSRMLIKKIILCTLPIALLGLLFGNLIQQYLFTPFFVAWMLVLGGIIFLWIEKTKKAENIKQIQEISYKLALFIGLFQCLALLPGFSRAGATIIGALLLGVERKTATLFSFFAAIPVLVAASIYSLFLYVRDGFILTSTELFILLLGFVISFVVAYMVINWFIKFISSHDFTLFGWYRIVLGTVIILLLLF